MQRYLILILILLVLFAPDIAFGQDGIKLNLKNYPTPPFAPNINIPEGQSLAGIAAWFYYFIISISGIAAFIMIVWGGIEYFTSAGNPAKVSDAKDRLKNVAYGLILVMASLLILRIIINPELSQLINPVIVQ
jgi:hypothetical protein